jgi:hypothetical protein
MAEHLSEENYVKIVEIFYRLNFNGNCKDGSQVRNDV